ncbi:MAG: SprB repeat-containing protein [Flavobacteriales bacterium]|nr:SprB repeat-containing protein [Flavobacteriales bacterium]
MLNCTNTTVTLDASGSTGTALAYNWSTAGGNIVSGGTTAFADVDAQGTYTVTVTDGSSGCTDTETVTVTQDVTNPTTTITCAPTSAVGTSDGSSSVSVGTAPTPYSYAWSPAPATGQGNVASATGLPTGNYTVTITASNGCTVTDGCTVNDPLCNVTVSISAFTNVSCNGGSDGTATIVMNGGSGTSYTYLWPDGQTTAIATGLSQGSMQGTVTDNNACFGTATANISEPTVLGAIATLDNNALCNGSSTGSVTASAIGGTTNYTYLWSTTETTATITGLPAATYTLTVTDANTCTDVASVTVNEPASMAITMTCNNTSVAGGSDGSSSASASGGDGSYSYLWTGGETTNSLTGLSAGAQAVTVTDGNSCAITATCMVNDPGCAVTVSTTMTGVTCNGGSDGQVSASALGGITPYTFIWSDTQSGATATGLSTGNITVSVTDGAGCPDNSIVSVTEPTVISPNMVCNATSVAGASDGSSTTSATGGASGYTYLWSTGATTSSLTGIPQGAYNVTVTDASLCAVTATCMVNDPGCAVTVSVTMTDVTCNGGTDGQVAASATGGLTPYSFIWSDGQTTPIATGLATGNITVTANGSGGCNDNTSISVTEPMLINPNMVCNATSIAGGSDGSSTTAAAGGAGGYTYLWSTGATTQNITGIPSGNYIVTVSDASLCAVTASCSVTDPGCALSITPAFTNVLCFGTSTGDVSVTVTGGITPYTYTWNVAGANSSVSALSAGVYNVTATGAGSCSITESITVSQPSTALAVTATIITDETCGAGDGEATMIASGGTTGYTFEWPSGATTANLSGLAAGGYNVTTTDGNNCTSINVATIGSIGGPSATVTTIGAQCNGMSNGSATLNVVGGISPYIYNWSTSAATPSIIGLAQGTYNYTVTNNDGTCAFTERLSLTSLLP